MLLEVPDFCALCQAREDADMRGQGSSRWRPDAETHEPNYDASECAALHIAGAADRVRPFSDIAWLYVN